MVSNIEKYHQKRKEEAEAKQIDRLRACLSLSSVYARILLTTNGCVIELSGKSLM